jgi:hypothetical protein
MALELEPAISKVTEQVGKLTLVSPVSEVEEVS